MVNFIAQRRTYMNIRIAFFSFAFLLTTYVQAQHLDIDSYISGKTLPFTLCYSMAQDSNGFMWFSAGKEVYRFDGDRFQKIHFARNASFEFIRKIKKLGRDVLVYDNKKIFVFRQDSLYEIKTNVATPDLVDIIQDKQGQYLVLLQDGLYKGKSLQDLSLHIRYSQGRINNQGQNLFWFNDSLLVTYSLGGKLIVFNLATKQAGIVAKTIIGMNATKQYGIVAAVEGEGIFQLASLQFIKRSVQVNFSVVYKYNIPNLKSMNIEEDLTGNIWVNVIQKKIIRINADGYAALFDETNGLPGTWFNLLFIDRENNLWLSQQNGLYKINTQQEARFTFFEGLYSNSIRGMAYDTNWNCIWLNTTKGINTIQGNTVRRHYQFNADESEQLLNLYPYQNQFLTTDAKQVKLLIKPSVINGKVQVQSFCTLPFHPTDIVVRKSQILAATTGGIFQIKKDQPIPLTDSVVHYRRLCWYDDSLLLAGGHSTGLYLFKVTNQHATFSLKKLEYQNYFSTPDESIDAVRSIYTDRQKRIWVGSRVNGLFCYEIKGNRLSPVYHYSNQPGFDNPNIIEINSDDRGRILLTTSAGIYEVIQQDKKVELKKANEFPIGMYTDYFVKHKNEYWLLIPPGIVRKQLNVTAEEYKYKTFITSLQAAGTEVKIQNGQALTTIPFKNNSLQIRFTSNNLTNEKEVKYSYRSGSSINNQWSTPSASHVVNLFGWLPGSYTFMVKAILPDGSETSPEMLLFTIATPFYRSWWFLTLAVLAMACLLHFVYVQRIKRVIEQERLRNSIARDLHDDLGSALSGIKLYSQLALQKMNDNDESRGLVEDIEVKSAFMMEAMSDIVWSVDPGNDTIEKIILRMKEYAAEMMEPAAINYSFQVSENLLDIKLDVNLRKNLYLIFKESINNIIKHANSTEVTISLQKEDKAITLLVQDNGVGLSPKSFKGNGIRNIKQRAAESGGTATIISSDGNGTVVTVRFTSPGFGIAKN